jgi:hypothetical protein
MSLRTPADLVPGSLDPQTFLAEIEAFRAAAADPGHSQEELRRALCRIVAHASLLDPNDAGFAGLGVSLKAALCAWLDTHPIDSEPDRSAAG